MVIAFLFIASICTNPSRNQLALACVCKESFLIIKPMDAIAYFIGAMG